MKLKAIPRDRYSDYRYRAIFGAYKWDPQVEDHNTVARHALLLSRDEADELEAMVQRLAEETSAMDEAFLKRPELARALGLSRACLKALGAMDGYDRRRHVRLMRFDFHPTTQGWMLSEVNSDVPGGLAEASVLPRLAQAFFDGYGPGKSTGDALLQAYRPLIESDAPVAFVHCTSYADDRQVMQYLADHFEANGIKTQFAAPDHIRWHDGRAHSIVRGGEGPLSGVVRFFPLEWLQNLPRGADWPGFFRAQTPSCNHPIALFTQSKRLPLVWDRLGVDIPTWKRLLPETLDPRQKIHPADSWMYIYKPALGRVGEGISIKEAVPAKEYAKIQRNARWHPKDWVRQRRFESVPVTSDDGESYHLCLGAFAVDGKPAGFYARISPHPRIDSKARDIPVLLAEEVVT